MIAAPGRLTRCGNMTDTVSLFEGEQAPPGYAGRIGGLDLRFNALSADANERVLEDIKRELLAGRFDRSGATRKGNWERGWQENLDDFLASDGDVDTLIPKFFNKNNIFRCGGRYVEGVGPTFESDTFKAVQCWLFETYFRDSDRIVEFGCGPGHNLFLLSSMYPNAQLVGCDWSQSACNLIDALSAKHGLNLESRLFDMFHPKAIGPDGGDLAIFAIGALEQLGKDFGSMLDYLVSMRPRMCVHIEPIVELYDTSSPFDGIAAQYHHQRGYLEGFTPALRALEKAGEISIHRLERLHFGSRYHEISVAAWGRP